MSIFKQKRQAERKSLIYYLETLDQSSGRLVGRIVDITIEGFRLISEESTTAGKIYQLSIHLPSKIDGVTAVSVNSRCVRCERDHYSRYYYSGFQFMGLDATTLSTIEKLIQQYEF